MLLLSQVTFAGILNIIFARQLLDLTRNAMQFLNAQATSDYSAFFMQLIHEQEADRIVPLKDAAARWQHPDLRRLPATTRGQPVP